MRSPTTLCIEVSLLQIHFYLAQPGPYCLPHLNWNILHLNLLRVRTPSGLQEDKFPCYLCLTNVFSMLSFLSSKNFLKFKNLKFSMSTAIIKQNCCMSNWWHHHALCHFIVDVVKSAQCACACANCESKKA